MAFSYFLRNLQNILRTSDRDLRDAVLTDPVDPLRQSEILRSAKEKELCTEG
jgi:hypothetical protein